MRSLRRSRRRRLESLTRLKAFKGCTDDELSVARSLMTAVHVPAGTTVITQNQAGTEFFIIENGTATVTRHEATIARLGPSDFFGELALIDDQPRNATVRAVTDLDVLVQNRREFNALLGQAPGFAGNVMRTMAQRLRAA